MRSQKWQLPECLREWGFSAQKITHARNGLFLFPLTLLQFKNKLKVKIKLQKFNPRSVVREVVRKSSQLIIFPSKNSFLYHAATYIFSLSLSHSWDSLYSHFFSLAHIHRWDPHSIHPSLQSPSLTIHHSLIPHITKPQCTTHVPGFFSSLAKFASIIIKLGKFKKN